MRHRCSGHLTKAGTDDPVGIIHIFGCHIAEAFENWKPGIGYQHIQAPKGLDRAFDQGIGNARIRQVSQYDLGFCTG
ncbi:MAG: hypothetical protein CM1200mP20_04470 [Pseudomonadota bacterium]|nr:MAG: hypothetical protein CM1200mP20_04470 [Pseudomonadota bacterium]